LLVFFSHFLHAILSLPKRNQKKLSLLSLNKQIGEEEGKSSGAVAAGPKGWRRRSGEIKNQFLKNEITFQTSFSSLSSNPKLFFEENEKKSLDLKFKFRIFFERRWNEPNTSKRKRLLPSSPSSSDSVLDPCVLCSNSVSSFSLFSNSVPFLCGSVMMFWYKTGSVFVFEVQIRFRFVRLMSYECCCVDMWLWFMRILLCCSWCSYSCDFFFVFDSQLWREKRKKCLLERMCGCRYSVLLSWAVCLRYSMIGQLINSDQLGCAWEKFLDKNALGLDSYMDLD